MGSGWVRSLPAVEMTGWKVAVEGLVVGFVGWLWVQGQG